jgi:Tol biopolymer transport system component
VGVALLASAVAPASFPGRNGRIAFERNATIVSMRPDGTGVKVIAQDADLAFQRPDWSPNGRQIAFSAGSIGPALMAADGSNRRIVPIGAVPPFYGAKLSFAPDGRHLAYGRNSHPDGLGPRVDIWRTRIDGLGDRRLARGWLPEWSPNGRMIAYVAGGIAEEGPIALINAKTGKLIRYLAARGGSSLDWSPDGRWLLYSRQTRTGLGFPDLFAIRADGRSSPRRLTKSRSQFEPRAVWSPDGRKIAFVRSRAFDEYSGSGSSIWTMRADGTHKKQIHRDASLLPDLSWQALPR